MANPPKKAVVQNVIRTEGSATITFVSKSGPLHFLGGQYVIFNCGFIAEEEKEIKRAYSIFSSDDKQEEFQIRIQPLNGGFASRYIPNLAIGSELDFSGPWGKFIANPSWPREGRILLVATDTGITAIISLLQSNRWKDKFERTTVLWFLSPADGFISVQEVLNLLPNTFHSLHILPISPIGDRLREKECLRAVTEELDSSVLPNNAFLAGDGKLIRMIRDVLLVRGLSDENIGLETFFHSMRESENVRP
ncbi:FAD-dependent oxidoreductase [Leptospira yasudae]|uniref:FAD-dependent oxidoreductase n=1 Tax=Leptospira yasudae TaxID=2202201 RepID=UPI00108405AF|nr:FAD-dependent oxidoreductase [Leptospira yasudae]TGK27752.1 FAD-dependent oxidoreductase [Leptospira yasudae]TGM06876.1 FAD-dependent oxidoreductase [Leptospira yasudae]